ncbi:MAG: glycosyl hydrolase family 17 protein [Bacillota bacterium]|nr:glycosyl hydrolase family 17 protein [Bacillota bacterium]
MKTKASRGKPGHRLLLPVLIIGSMLLTIGFGGSPAAASEEPGNSLLPDEVSQSSESAPSAADATNDLETTQSNDVTPPAETSGSEDKDNTATVANAESEESGSEIDSLSPESESETLAAGDTEESVESAETSESPATDPTAQNDAMPAGETGTVGYSPLQATAQTDAGRSSVTLKFSVVEKGKPDSEQLTGSHVQLIHNDESYMDDWDVSAQPVEKELIAGEYQFSAATLPAGYAVCPGVIFRINEDLSVAVATDSSDPDPANWTWTALAGDTLRLELEHGAPFYFRNIDLMNPAVDLEGGKMGLRLSNGAALAWTSGSKGKRFYLSPGTEAVYIKSTAPAGYVGSDPIRFKTDDNNNLYVQDPNGSWFLQADNTLVMENMPEMHAGHRKHQVALGAREHGESGLASLPGAVVKLQRFNSVSGDYYDIPGMEWTTGQEHRVVSLFVGDYRLVALTSPKGYEHYAGTEVFRLVDEGDGLSPSFCILYQPADSSPLSWQPLVYESCFNNANFRIAVFRTGSKTSYSTGERLALAARAEGGEAPFRYQFYVIRSNGAKVILRNYAFSNIFNWVPLTPDTYQVGVSVMDAAGTEINQEKTVTVSRSTEAPLRIAVFRTGNRTTYNTGERVALAARAEGGTAPYRYQFYVVRSNGSKVILRNYAFSNIFNWIPLTADTYQLGVNVEDDKGRVVSEVKTVTVKKGLTVAVFRAGSKSTYKVGEIVALAARGEDGATPYRYQFYVYRSNGAKVILRDYGYSNIFNWKPTTPDSYRVCVAICDAKGAMVTAKTPVEVKPCTAERLVIAMTYTPVYGEFGNFEGLVFGEDGGCFDPASYRISLYLQLSAGGSYWVKPTFAKPYTDLNSDGSFSISYATGGSDQNATHLHIMLIPSTCTPAASFEQTRAQALDYVLITRTAAGDVTVEPERQAPGQEGGHKSSGLVVSADRIAVNVGFYTDGSAPGSGLSLDLIQRQLEHVAEFSDTVRIFGSAGELGKVYPLARTLGFTVIGTAWLCGDENADKLELDALIANCNNGLVRVACVGSETLLRGDLTPDELIWDINYVRERLTDSSIPVTTADSVDVLLSRPEVRNACDILMPNCYPYWAGVSITDAGANFAASMASLKARAAGKEIVVSETGWPTAGQTIGDANAGEQEAAQYFEAVRNWSLSTGTPLFWFEAADEPWKTADEGASGAHWGILTNDFVLKDAYAETDFFSGY